VNDERDLLRRVRTVEEEALGEAFDAYYRPLYRYIYCHVGHQETAEDLTADVFNRLLKEIERGRGPHRYLKAWLFRVARNVVTDEFRRFQYRDHDQIDERTLSPVDSISHQAETAILGQEVRSALEELTSKQRDVIILKYLEGYENREIARLLGTTVGAVKALQHRGLAALRRHLVRTGVLKEESK
jgi:RNA polymerase sigma-70 factor (ECF subfamily)